MSCYVDVGDSGIALGPGAHQITVNPGVREDAVDAFLTKHDLMFKTVTAGGFFSLGGMTAADGVQCLSPKPRSDRPVL